MRQVGRERLWDGQRQEEKKRRRQATPRCGRHVRLYEPPPPSVPSGFLPSSARRFPSRRRCNGGRGGNLKMGSLLAGCAYCQSFSSPLPEVTLQTLRDANAGISVDRPLPWRRPPDPTMVISLTPPRLALFGHIKSASTTGLPHLIRHVRGHCAPFQQFVKDSTTWPRGRTQHDQQAGAASFSSTLTQRSRPWLRHQDRWSNDAGLLGIQG